MMLLTPFEYLLIFSYVVVVTRVDVVGFSVVLKEEVTIKIGSICNSE